MFERMQITRAAELETLGAFRQFIEAARRRFDLDEDTGFELKLAVDEACTNIITHGYAGMNPGSIILALTFEPEQVRVEITDFGHAFEPYETPRPDVQAALEDRPEGGFGLYFIYQTMDEIHYETKEEGNVLTFIKRLKAGT